MFNQHFAKQMRYPAKGLGPMNWFNTYFTYLNVYLAVCANPELRRELMADVEGRKAIRFYQKSHAVMLIVFIVLLTMCYLDGGLS